MTLFKKKVFILLGLLLSPLFSQVHNIEASLYGLFLPADRQFLIYPENSVQHPGWLDWDSNRTIEIGFGYNDIFREWKDNLPLISIHQSGAGIGFRYPFKWLNTRALYTAGISARYFRFKDYHKSRDIEFNISSFPTYSITNTLVFKNTKHQFGLNIVLVRGSNNNKMTINKFPHDEDADVNTFFFDLLEPTFGDEIFIRAINHQWALLAEYSFAISGQLKSGISIGTEAIRDNYNFSYFNSTEKISGFKKFKAPLKSDKFIATLSQQYLVHLFTFTSSFSYSTQESHFQADALNPTKSEELYLEFKKLGKSDFSKESLSAGLGTSIPLSGSIKMAATWRLVNNTFNGEADFTTPVLGFEILPIAHQFVGTYTGNTLVNFFQMNYAHQINPSFQFQILAEYLTSTAKINYDALAKMEFGLGENPEKDKLDYMVDIYKVALKMEFKLDQKWTIYPNIIQIVPDIVKKKKKKTMPKPEPKIRVKRSAWGGTFYNLVFQYNF
jgi:hypothetical protein